MTSSSKETVKHFLISSVKALLLWWLPPFDPLYLTSFVLRAIMIAVGTPVTRRPPHRPVRAVFPHTVLASGNDADTDQRIRMTDTDSGKPPVNEAFQPIPSHSVLLAAPLKY